MDNQSDNREQMEDAAEAILDILEGVEDEEALTAAYTVACFLIFARYQPTQWQERVNWVRERIPVVFQGLLDEVNRQRQQQKVSQ